jgi:flagellar motor switch protein FliN/FliY
MDTDGGAAASTPDTPSDGGGLPSWAVQKMQEFADTEADGGEAPATAAPIAAAPTTTSVIAGAQPADAGPQISPQFAQYAPNLELMLDLPLDVSVELGHAELPLAHVLGLKAGSVVQLDKLPGEPLDLLVNGQLVARGEIVVLNDTFAFRITDLIED